MDSLGDAGPASRRRARTVASSMSGGGGQRGPEGTGLSPQQGGGRPGSSRGVGYNETVSLRRHPPIAAPPPRAVTAGGEAGNPGMEG